MKCRVFSYLALTVLCCMPGALRGQNIVWPLAPQNQVHKIWNAYGELTGTKNHFHEAVDMPVPPGTPVLAVQNGVIVEKAGGGDPYSNYLTVGISPHPYAKAWGYVHLVFGKNPVKHADWQVNDTVRVGDTLGTVVGTATVMAHLHFEYDNNANGWSPTGATTADLNGTPIEYLSPRTDDVPPTISTPFFYRSQTDENKPAAVYFSSTTASGIRVVKDNLDIIAKAYDRFGNFDGTNYDLNVRKIEFKVDPAQGTGSIPYQESESFSGLFLSADAPAGRNAFNKFQDPLRTTVLYEDDNTARSVYHPLDGSAGGALYYILTNIDDDYNLEMSDTSRYWDTNGKEGEAWNDNNEGAGHEATKNADAAFPDGKYAVTVRVTGQADAAEVTATDSIFINNFDETIESCDQTGRVKNRFQSGKPVFAKGDGFPKNRQFTLYVVKNTTWVHGMSIPSDANRIAAVQVTTDANGEIPPTQVWASYAPNGNPDAGYDMIVDYDSDGKYSDKREGKVVDPIDDADINEAGFKEAKVDVAFIIDDTGSMGEEIAGVRSALLAHLATYSDTSGTVFQLVTFKDGVSPRDPTANLATIQSQVSDLVASGGGDCPEASVEAISATREGMTENSRVFVATDASPHPGLDIDAAIGALRTGGVRVDVILSGDCTPSADLVSRGSGNSKVVSPEVTPKTMQPQVLNTAILHTSILLDTLKLGDDDCRAVLLPFPFSFGGQSYYSVFVCSNGFITFGVGDYTPSGTSSSLLSGPRRIAALWRDLDPNSGGRIYAGQVGSEFQVVFDSVRQYGSPKMVSFVITLRQNGSFAVAYGPCSVTSGLVGFSVGHSVPDPGEINLSAQTQPIQTTANGTAYEYFASDDFDLTNKTLEYAPVTYIPPRAYTGVEAFSLFARETGGIFSYIPEVNSGDTTQQTRYQNATFNIVQGGITRSIALATPPSAPRGSRLAVILTGSGTNFRPGTNILFSGSDITVNSVNVRSPIEVEATIQIAATAATGFRDVLAITNLGSGAIDTARGLGTFRISSATASPAIVGISPTEGRAGQSLTVVVYGANTHFASTSVPSLGSGITVQSVSAASSTELHVSVVISTSAVVGYRDVAVTTGGETATESMTGPFFVSLPSPNLPEIASVSPSSGRPGTTSTVTIRGRSTSFTNGVTTASFSGTGLTVLSTSVSDTTSATAHVQIASNATPGYRDVRVTTGSEAAVLLNGFLVSASTPVLIVQQAPMAFGAWTAKAGLQKVLMVKNADTATAALAVDSTVMGGQHASEFTVVSGGPPFTVNARDSHAVAVQFKPLTLGQKNASLRLVCNDPVRPSVSITLSGEGTISLVTSVLQNPAASRYADIVVVSDVLLQNRPTATIGVLPDSTVITTSLVSGADRVYTGAYEFRQAGTFTMRTSSSDSGITVSLLRTFNTILARPGFPATLVTSDRQVQLELSADVLSGETFLIADTRGTNAGYECEFGPAVTLMHPAVLEISFSRKVFEDPSKLFIFALDNGQWKRLPSQVFTTSNRVRSRVNALGAFKLGLDPTFTGTNIIPTTCALRQNYPNPFNPTTTIEYDLPVDGQISIVVYDVLGREVRTLINEGQQLAGTRTAVWDATSNSGVPVSSGVYLYRMKAGTFSQVRRLLLLK